MNEPEFGAIDANDLERWWDRKQVIWIVGLVLLLVVVAVVAGSGVFSSESERACCWLCNCGAKLSSSGS